MIELAPNLVRCYESISALCIVYLVEQIWTNLQEQIGFDIASSPGGTD
jgi:hypothetical protein